MIGRIQAQMKGVRFMVAGVAAAGMLLVAAGVTTGHTGSVLQAAVDTTATCIFNLGANLCHAEIGLLMRRDSGSARH